ncbi:hypothetical protein MTO96_036829, partial [Rhipicephalus appendiculatus]
PRYAADLSCSSFRRRSLSLGAVSKRLLLALPPVERVPLFQREAPRCQLECHRLCKAIGSSVWLVAACNPIRPWWLLRNARQLELLLGGQTWRWMHRTNLSHRLRRRLGRTPTLMLRVGETDEHRVTLKREEDCPSDASHSRNTKLYTDEIKVGGHSVDRDVRVKVEKDECCSGVQNPEETVRGEDMPLIRPVCDVESEGARVDCGVVVKEEPEECVDEPQVPRIVCAVGCFYNTSTTPGVVQRVLARHLVRHPEEVKLPLTWSYHK